MNRSLARTALAVGALALSGAALAPSAAASSAYPPVTPPGNTTTVSNPAPPAAAAPPVTAAAPTVAKGSSSRPAVASLAYTGAEVGTVGALGLGLVVGGAALVRSSRRSTAGL